MKVFVFSSFKKRWVEYDGPAEEALKSRLPEHVYTGNECPGPWFRSAGMKELNERTSRRSSYIERRHRDGDPTPGIFRDRD